MFSQRQSLGFSQLHKATEPAVYNHSVNDIVRERRSCTPLLCAVRGGADEAHMCAGRRGPRGRRGHLHVRYNVTSSRRCQGIDRAYFKNLAALA